MLKGSHTFSLLPKRSEGKGVKEKDAHKGSGKICKSGPLECEEDWDSFVASPKVSMLICLATAHGWQSGQTADGKDLWKPTDAHAPSAPLSSPIQLGP